MKVLYIIGNNWKYMCKANFKSRFNYPWINYEVSIHDFYSGHYKFNWLKPNTNIKQHKIVENYVKYCNKCKQSTLYIFKLELIFLQVYLKIKNFWHKSSFYIIDMLKAELLSQSFEIKFQKWNIIYIYIFILQWTMLVFSTGIKTNFHRNLKTLLYTVFKQYKKCYLLKHTWEGILAQWFSEGKWTFLYFYFFVSKTLIFNFFY